MNSSKKYSTDLLVFLYILHFLCHVYLGFSILYYGRVITHHLFFNFCSSFFPVLAKRLSLHLLYCSNPLIAVSMKSLMLMSLLSFPHIVYHWYHFDIRPHVLPSTCFVSLQYVIYLIWWQIRLCTHKHTRPSEKIEALVGWHET